MSLRSLARSAFAATTVLWLATAFIVGGLVIAGLLRRSRTGGGADRSISAPVVEEVAQQPSRGPRVVRGRGSRDRRCAPSSTTGGGLDRLDRRRRRSGRPGAVPVAQLGELGLGLGVEQDRLGRRHQRPADHAERAGVAVRVRPRPRGRAALRSRGHPRWARRGCGSAGWPPLWPPRRGRGAHAVRREPRHPRTRRAVVAAQRRDVRGRGLGIVSRLATSLANMAWPTFRARSCGVITRP